jgi:hypothetical protein
METSVPVSRFVSMPLRPFTFFSQITFTSLIELDSLSQKKLGIRPVIDSRGHSPHTRLVTVLLICSDTERLELRKAALQTAGFHSVTARSVDEGWTKINFFDISAVVIDHEFADDPRAKELGTHYLTLQLEADALPEQVALELVEQFGKGSELVQ